MQERTGAGASRRLPLSSAYLRPVLRLVLQLVLHGDMAVRPCGRLLGSAPVTLFPFWQAEAPISSSFTTLTPAGWTPSVSVFQPSIALS